MTEEGVPVEIRDFLLACIDSVAELEALLLMRGSPDQDWDVFALARRLYVAEAEAAKILSNLSACELIQKRGESFRYHARDPERGQLADRLAQTYARYLVPVTQIIHDKGTGIRKFADAFKFRKDK